MTSSSGTTAYGSIQVSSLLPSFSSPSLLSSSSLGRKKRRQAREMTRKGTSQWNATEGDKQSEPSMLPKTQPLAHRPTQAAQMPISPIQAVRFRSLEGQSEPSMLPKTQPPAHRATRLLILPSIHARTSTRGRRHAPCFALATISWRPVPRSQQPVPLESLD